MTLTETLAWGLGLLAFARLVLVPIGDYLSRRHAAAATRHERHQRKRAPGAPHLPITIKQAGQRLGALIAPRDRADKGNWNDHADIPLWAGLASLALAAFFLFGPTVLGWMPPTVT